MPENHIQRYIEELPVRGIYHFKSSEIVEALHVSRHSVWKTLRQLGKKGRVARPYKGFYVVVPPEHRSIGCLPPAQFIPHLMHFLEKPYYVGLLSAAEYHGVAHQKPQVFQVVTDTSLRDIQCGRVRVEFIERKNIKQVATEQRNTPMGYVQIATPETVVFDLVNHPGRSGQLNNIATILSEIGEKLDSNELLKAGTLLSPPCIQRVGYLLELCEWREKTTEMARYVERHAPRYTPLSPHYAIKGHPRNRRWRIVINTDVEPDID
jgi:predicted transcriptional regulator of viral defense system